MGRRSLSPLYFPYDFAIMILKLNVLMFMNVDISSILVEIFKFLNCPFFNNYLK